MARVPNAGASQRRSMRVIAATTLHLGVAALIALGLAGCFEANSNGAAPAASVNGATGGANMGRRLDDPTAHGEMQAIRHGLAQHGSAALRGASLYTSGEPCAMCMKRSSSADAGVAVARRRGALAKLTVSPATPTRMRRRSGL